LDPLSIWGGVEWGDTSDLIFTIPLNNIKQNMNKWSTIAFWGPQQKTTVCSILTVVCVCTWIGEMKSTNYEWGHHTLLHVMSQHTIVALKKVNWWTKTKQTI